MTEPSILDARLAEIDRRLSTIQIDLEPARPEQPAQRSSESPPPLAVAAATTPATTSEPLTPPTPLRPETYTSQRNVEDRLDVLIAQLGDLTDAHERLLELHRELLGQYASLLEHNAAAATAPAAATVSLEAGPFTNGRSLRLFESSLATLPDVATVEVREYLGTDRVMLEVRLNPAG